MRRELITTGFETVKDNKMSSMSKGNRIWIPDRNCSEIFNIDIRGKKKNKKQKGYFQSHYYEIVEQIYWRGCKGCFIASLNTIQIPLKPRLRQGNGMDQKTP